MREPYPNRHGFILGTAALLVLMSLACGSTSAPSAVDISGIQTAAVKTALAGVQLPQTQAVQPTANAGPTPQPPTAEPNIPEAAPVNVSGSGDSIQDVSAWPQLPGVMIVQGNSAGRFFAITPYDPGGNGLAPLVMASEPYKGTVPFNFDGDHATRLEIKATDAWAIQIAPLTQARTLSVPGSIQGTGDDVIVLTGAAPDTATVSGNAASRFFAVTPYERTGHGLMPLLMSGDPYQGTVIVDRAAAILQIQAVGDWSIAITAAQ